MVVFYSSARFRDPLRRLKKTALSALSALKKDRFYLEIYLIGNTAIRSLNRRFRHKDKITNVLSFSADGCFPAPELAKGFVRLGEIYIAPDRVKDEKEDIDYLLIHGILHLLGYTHYQKRDTIEMEKTEKRILKALKPNNYDD